MDFFIVLKTQRNGFKKDFWEKGKTITAKLGLFRSGLKQFCVLEEFLKRIQAYEKKFRGVFSCPASAFSVFNA
jgi:hypothetical protein